MAESYVLGGYKTNTLTGKVIKIGSASASINASGTCMKVLGVDYQVTAGKTFYLTGFQWVAHSATNAACQIRYADDAALTTNPVVMVFIAAGGTIALFAPTAGIQTIVPCGAIAAPATKYVGIFNTAAFASTETVFMIGYEA